MKSLQQRLIELTQAGLAVVASPYSDIADQLGITETDVFALLEEMKNNGLIRRIGAVPNHYALGYQHNLMTVWDVADDDADTFGQRLGELDFVSHCYLRPRHLPDWPYNLFAMVHGRSATDADDKVSVIKQLLGRCCRQHSVLPSTKILKKTGVRI